MADYITVKAAVERGCVSRSTLKRWIDDGSVRSFVQGHSRYVSVSDIRSRMAQCRVEERSAIGEEQIDQLATEIAKTMPSLTEAQIDRLTTLLANER